jgi:predicted HTH transcriptional regulator
LQELNNYIQKHSSELSINPLSFARIDTGIEHLMDSLTVLREVDRARKKIKGGESSTVEFKQTFSLNLEDFRKNRNHILSSESKEKPILAVLKTIAAFLNTQGGTLFIGVNDSGEVLGFSRELESMHRNNLDTFKKTFKDVFSKRVGAEHSKYYSLNPINFGDEVVIEIKCERSKTPCFVDGEYFYIRTEASSEKLHGKKLLEYAFTHFNR